MALGRLLRSFPDHKLTTRQRRLDCLDHSAKVGEFVVLFDRLVIPKLTGFIFAQIAQFPVMAACPLAAALQDALLGQGVQSVAAEHCRADAAIQAI